MHAYLQYYIYDVYHKSEYILTVTNFASIFANCFYFLQKVAALRPFVLNFLRSKVLNKPSKNGFVGRGLQRLLLKLFM